MRLLEALLKNKEYIDSSAEIYMFIEKPSCASCLLFLVQAQNLLSRTANVNFIISNPVGARVSEFIKTEALQKPLLDGPNRNDGLSSMIGTALRDIVDSLAQELVEAGIGTSDLDKVKIALNRIIRETITGNYYIEIRDEVTHQILETHQAIPWFMEQLSEINRLWGLVKASNQA